MGGPRGSAERASAQMYADRMRTEIISLRAEVGRLKEAAKPRSYHDVTDLYEDPPEPAITAPDDAMFCSKHELIREQRKRERVWKVADELERALRHTREVVHQYHGDVAWELYRDNCPELAPCRTALANHAKLKGE